MQGHLINQFRVRKVTPDDVRRNLRLLAPASGLVDEYVDLSAPTATGAFKRSSASRHRSISALGAVTAPGFSRRTTLLARAIELRAPTDFIRAMLDDNAPGPWTNLLYESCWEDSARPFTALGLAIQHQEGKQVHGTVGGVCSMQCVVGGCGVGVCACECVCEFVCVCVCVSVSVCVCVRAFVSA
jgi:hypothetical protein